jgi:hypothetical protein
MTWASRSSVNFEREMADTILGGFGDDAAGEDRFDAALGVFGMIEVVTGRRSEGPAQPEIRTWEGWILGQAR